MTRSSLVAIVCFFALSQFAVAQTTSATAAQANTSYIDDHGAAHITRVVPVPQTVSPEARHLLARPAPDVSSTPDVAQFRTYIDAWQKRTGDAELKLYPAKVSESEIAGIPVRVVTPLRIGQGKADRVLVNLHGGGFVVDSGSLSETIPIANLTQTKVISVLYRRAPEHPFPAQLEDAIAVYRELLKTYRPSNIAIFGSSAGAILTAETAVRIKQLGLPMPAALGIFSGMGDFSRIADSTTIFGLDGLAGPLQTPVPDVTPAPLPEYVGKTDRKDPVLSPVFADLRGMPPTLFLTSTRDLLLGGTTILHRAYVHAGVDARLIVFEALPHTFWNEPDLPESREAFEFMAVFLDGHVGKQPVKLR